MSHHKHRHEGHHGKSRHAAEAPPEPGDGLLVGVELLLGALLLFAPLAFGAVEAWSELVVLGLVAAMVVLVLARVLLYPGARVVRTWAYVPIVAFLAWAALALVPLPSGVARVLSPAAVDLRAAVWAGLPGAEAALSRVTLSVYPHATRHDLRLVGAAAGVFFVVVNAYRRPAAIRRLLWTVVGVGVVVIALALAQDATGAARIYWVGPPGRGAATAGPFVHYSHFGQFVNLCVGAALGLALQKLYEVFRRDGFRLADAHHRIYHPKMRVVWGLAVVFFCGLAAVLMSGSRSATIGAAAGLACAAVGLAQHRLLRQMGWVVLGLVVVIAVGALVFEFRPISEKLASLRGGEDVRQRLQILQDLREVWKKFPVAGTGLGTHQVVFPMVDTSTVPEIATHAENEYAQVLTETGGVGLTIVIAFLTMIWVAWRRAIRANTRAVQVAAVGLGFGLAAVLLNSFADFGQHVPANACLTAVVCGLMVALAKLRSPAEVEQAAAAAVATAPVSIGWRAGRWVTAALVAGGFGWALLGAESARRAEASWALAREAGRHIAEAPGLPANELYAELLGHMQAAVAAAPDNVTYAYELNCVRWRAISRVRDGRGAVVLPPTYVKHTRRIVDELHGLQFVCPTYAAPVVFAGELEAFVLADTAAAGRSLRVAYGMTPGDQTACLLAAGLDVREGKVDAAVAKLTRYLQRGGGFGAVIDLLGVGAGRPELVIALAGESYDNLQQVATAFERSSTMKAIATDARARALAVLRARCEAADAPPELLVRLAKEDYARRELDGAIDCYRRALLQEYGQVEWRMELARVLAEADRVGEAMREVRVCMRLREEYPEAKKLLGELSLRPGATLE